ncbi:hypothetical protein FB451DRAFT_1169606 [Mycena latifolia]|nr:hypothetical protein FB451DRAFT_1169606 [Mycena latifolia]
MADSHHSASRANSLDIVPEEATLVVNLPFGLELANIPSLDDRPLTTYRMPSERERFDDEYLHRKFLHLPSNFSQRDYIFTLDEMKRKTLAYRFGREAFGRPAIDIPLSRSQARRIFKHDLNLLKQALTEVYEYSDPSENTIYGLDRHLMSLLTSALASRRRAASDDFYRKCQVLPEYPVWAETGNFGQFLELNEFEIASATFREEVERFLQALTNYHAFPSMEDPDQFISHGDGEAPSPPVPKGKSPWYEDPGNITAKLKAPQTRFKGHDVPPHQMMHAQPITVHPAIANPPPGWYSNQNESISTYAQPLNTTGQHMGASASAGPSFWGNRSTFQSSGYMKEIYDAHLPDTRMEQSSRPYMNIPPLTYTGMQLFPQGSTCRNR